MKKCQLFFWMMILGRLAELRQLMENEEELRTVFDKLYLVENSAG